MSSFIEEYNIGKWCKLHVCISLQNYAKKTKCTKIKDKFLSKSKQIIILLTHKTLYFEGELFTIGYDKAWT